VRITLRAACGIRRADARLYGTSAGPEYYGGPHAAYAIPTPDAFLRKNAPGDAYFSSRRAVWHNCTLCAPAPRAKARRARRVWALACRYSNRAGRRDVNPPATRCASACLVAVQHLIYVRRRAGCGSRAFPARRWRFATRDGSAACSTLRVPCRRLQYPPPHGAEQRGNGTSSGLGALRASAWAGLQTAPLAAHHLPTDCAFIPAWLGTRQQTSSMGEGGKNCLLGGGWGCLEHILKHLSSSCCKHGWDHTTCRRSTPHQYSMDIRSAGRHYPALYLLRRRTLSAWRAPLPRLWRLARTVIDLLVLVDCLAHPHIHCSTLWDRAVARS